MIRTKPSTGLIEQKPRKMLKLDLIQQKQYNQFEGNSDIDEEVPKHQHEDHQDSSKNKLKQETHLDIGKQINTNQEIFNLISQSQLKFRKVDDLIKPRKDNKNAPSESTQPHQIKKQTLPHPSIKFEQGTEPTIVKTQNLKPTVEQNKKENKNDKQKSKEKPKPAEPSSNWKKFLQTSKTPNKSLQKTITNNAVSNSSNNAKTPTSNQPSKFVAMDCEFVKCGQSDQLARISIVSQTGQTLYDSYIKPQAKVTDFLTEITGITYSHIKQAPKWSQQIPKVKKILMGKILVGHTLDKDLEVTKLTNWKGISQKINIADFSQYREKGGSKIVSLKRMALSFLNRNIQSGWHSSVEDAVATMDLFKLNKKKILKELKLI